MPGATIADLNDRYKQELGLPASLKGVVLTSVDPKGRLRKAGCVLEMSW